MSAEGNVLTVGLGSCGVAAGGLEVVAALRAKLATEGVNAELRSTGCCGMCHREVLLELETAAGGRFVYGDVTVERANRIVRQHLREGRPVDEWLVVPPGTDLMRDPFFATQRRIVLRHCGVIDPESLGAYVKAGGYRSLAKVLKEWTPQQVIDEVKKSGLRGRGGAGFPTGVKWQFCRDAAGEPKYLICNADEGDPGAFMDRSVLESDPHSVLEGMLIAAYAIGSSEGYVYCRAEYPLAVKRLNQGIAQLRERGYLGDRILGSPLSFTLKVKEGAGAFVCGEETALMASLEGKRGMPRLRPPFPAQQGLFGKPSNINNVETFANVPWIIENGGEAFAAMGTASSKGTKVFALAGKIKKGGLVEVPMGVTLRTVVTELGGGTSSGLKLKAVQMGGPSGGCIPERLFDTVVDYEKVTATGAIMGSGGMVVMDESSCMVDIARFFLNFTQDESCGKCTFCRVGTKRMLEILTRITEGRGQASDLPLLEELAAKVAATSLCGLGQTAPNPVLTTLRYFREEYEAHIHEHRCPALKCRALLRYEIEPAACKGCTLCARACPVKAISGQKGRPFTIDRATCVKCGLCMDKCRFNAIAVRSGGER